MRRLGLLLVAAALAVLAVGAAAQGRQAPQAGGSQQPDLAKVRDLCEGTGPIEAKELKDAAKTNKIPPGQCKLQGRVLTDGGVGAKVPPPGEGVGVAAVKAAVAGKDLPNDEFEIATAPDGTVSLGLVGPGFAPGKEASRAGPSGSNLRAASGGECDSVAYNVTRHESDVFYWRLDYDTVANLTTLGTQEGIDAIRRGAYNMTYTFTDCDRAGGNTKYSATASFLGDTDRFSQVGGGGACGGNDGESVVNFREITTQTENKTLAVTCYFFNPTTREIQSADISFESTSTEWDGIGAGCGAGEYDLTGVATHEWGHVFGMNHVPESGASLYMTMSPLINGTCQGGERTLGYGDYLGMKANYS